jgi:hypothetical protein
MDCRRPLKANPAETPIGQEVLLLATKYFLQWS